MRQTTSLIMLTAEYPFGEGETFIETELEVVSKYFDQVLLIPSVKGSLTRSVPENVVVLEGYQHKTNLIEVVNAIFKFKEVRQEFMRNFMTGIGKNKVMMGNLWIALKTRGLLKKVLKGLEGNNLVLYSYWLDTSAMALALLESDLPKIARCHGWDVYESRQRFQYLPLRPFMLSKLSKVHSVSENGRKHILTKFPVFENLTVSRLGVLKSVDEIDSHSSFSEMVSISSVVPIKRVDFIASVYFTEFQDRIKWSHYGSGDFSNKYKNQFKEIVQNGFISNSEIYDVLQSKMKHAFLINLSETEGIPVSMMEAMSFGIPCIGTKVGGVGEIIKDGYNGYLLSSNPTKDEVVNAVNRLLSLTTQERLFMRRAAYFTWKEKFNGEENYTRFAEDLLGLKLGR